MSDLTISNSYDSFNAESWLEPTELKIKSLWEWSSPSDTPIRIAICGAAGTGKKDLAEQLGKQLDIPVIAGVTRMLAKLGFKINKGADISMEIAALLANVCSLLEYDDDVVAADSLIDVLAYSKYLADKTQDKSVKYINRAMANMVHTLIYDLYTVFFYMPLVEKPKSDGIRSIDMKFQEEVDKNIRYYLNAFDIDYFPLTGKPKEKLNLAMDYLNEFDLLTDRDI
jgi:nicotinamide riboside kinase